MAANPKSKEIQVQRPAQSLQAFQKKVASADDTHEGLLKPIAIGGGVVAALAIGFFGFRAWQHHRIEKHEAAISALVREVQGTDPAKPVPPEQAEKRMKEQLPTLEALARSAPGSRANATHALLSSWKLQLEGKGAQLPPATEPWDRVRLAQRAIALGQGKEAMDLLAPLKKKAAPGEPWSGPFWTGLMETHALLGQREQAWKDLADYKARFKDQADTAAMERLINGI